MSPITASDKALSRGLLDVLIRAGLTAVLVIFCFRIFHPFLNLMLWSVILAITLYPLQVRVRRALGGQSGRAATLIVLIAIAILAVPVYLLAIATTDSVDRAVEMLKGGSFSVPPPPESVASWPLVGKPLHGVWLQAAGDLTSLAQKFAPQLKGFALALLSHAAAVGTGLLMVLVALIIAGVIMAHGESGHRSAGQIGSRLFGADRGPRIVALGSATIRAVAQGVVGIAFIQALLIGVGFAVMAVPAAGLLALAVLLLGIMQVPVTLITLPVILWMFAAQGASVATIVFAAYVFVAGLVDNVLKPLMLGRGVDVPMPVILIGALGGMVTNGVLGLFIGPVALAVGYQLFWAWVRDPGEQPNDMAPPRSQPVRIGDREVDAGDASTAV
jgi:predicted PurR-regulated permease PerM